MPGGPQRIVVLLQSTEEAGEQGDEGDADQRDTSTGHELLHALAFGTGVVIAVTLQKIDKAPHTETSAKGDHEGLKHLNSGSKKIHITRRQNACLIVFRPLTHVSALLSKNC